MGVKRPYEEQLHSAEYDSSNDGFSDDNCLSSDDSVDLNVSSGHPTSADVPSQKYGVGAQLMAKMGYTLGSGLGADGSGIVDPIELEKRQKRAGLGMEAAEPAPLKTQAVTNTHDDLAASSKFARLLAVKDELDLILQQQNLLKRALLFVNSAGMNLDIVEFYNALGKDPIWHIEKLYEVPALVLRSRIPNVDAFEWLVDHQEVLLAANEALPEDEWGRILAEKWLRSPCKTLPQLVNQWVVGRSHGFAAAGRYLSEMFSESQIVRQSVGEGRQFLADLVSVIPDASGLVKEIRHSVLHYSLQDQKTVLATIPLETAVIGKVVAARPDLSTQADLVTALSETLDAATLSEALEKTSICEKWLDQLFYLLTQPCPGVKVKEWWYRWRPFYSMFTDDAVQPWLKAGLDGINAVLDGVQPPGRKSLPVSQQTQSQTKVHSTLKDVLDHVCYMNDFEMTPTTTGYTVKSVKREVELVLEKDVVMIRQSQSLIPVSLDALQSYLLKT